MAEVITNHGESLIAEKMGSNAALDADTMILSYDPELNPEDPIDRDTELPPSEQIVYEDSVSQTGYVSPNQVVYSLFMDNTVGPFEFNRMDLVVSQDDNTNIAIATFPTQNKIAEDPENGIRGQSMTRNFMTVYDGAQAVTGITVEAAVWQIDFMARLHSADELERNSTRDTYGRACFWQDAFQVINNDGQFQYLPGTAYVEGIRLSRENVTDIDPGTLPKNVWLDVSLQGNLNGITAFIESIFSTSEQSDYTDSNGVDHYLEKVAEIDSSGVVTDTRRSVDILDHLLAYLESPQWENVQGKPDEATRWPTHEEVTGLGEAATRSVGESETNVMEVGAFGLGKSSLGDQRIISDMDDPSVPAGFYGYKDVTPGTLPGEKFGSVLVMPYRAQADGVTNGVSQQLAFQTRVGELYDSPSVRIFYRVYEQASGGWTPWAESIHTGNIEETQGSTQRIRLPGGFMIQIGQVEITDVDQIVTVTLPETYGNTNFRAFSTNNREANVSGMVGSYTFISSNSTIKVIHDGASSTEIGPINWMTIGYKS